MKNLDCVFLAAGFGKRMRRKIPKQFIRIGGKPIMIYPLEILVKSGLFNKIIITYPESYLDKFKEIISNYFIKKENFVFVKGGKTRQESVYNAIPYVETDRVLIHEASWPLTSLDLFKKISSGKGDCVVPVVKTPLTTVIGNRHMKTIFKRDILKNIQLPQAFNTSILKESHETARKDNLFFTDDSTLVHHYGHKVKFIEGDEKNIKITTPWDLVLFELIFFVEPTYVW